MMDRQVAWALGVPNDCPIYKILHILYIRYFKMIYTKKLQVGPWFLLYLWNMYIFVHKKEYTQNMIDTIKRVEYIICKHSYISHTIYTYSSIW